MVLIIIIAGIAGTFLMTCFMYLAAIMIDKRLKVVKVLGTMLTNRTGPGGQLSRAPAAIYVGTIVHYLVGVFFSLVYYGLWTNGIGSPSFRSGLVFGFLTGLVAAAGWRLFLALKQNAVNLPIALYLFFIAVAHIVFALGVIVTYELFHAKV